MELDEFLLTKTLKEKVKNKSHRGILEKVILEDIKNKEHYDYVMNGYQDFITYKHLMKNDDIAIEHYFQDENKKATLSFENFNDNVQKTIIKNKANKLKRRIISNKYRHLCNDNTDKLFSEIAQLDFNNEEIQNFIGKKIAAFHTAIELNAALENLIELKSNWSPEGLEEKIEKFNLIEGKDYEIESNKYNQICLHLKTFKATNSLGSRMWCITREKRMFDMYKTNDINDYKILFDFNKNPADDFSMVAMLTNIQGEINDVYTKSDVALNTTDMLEYKNYIKENLKPVSIVDSLRRAQNESDNYIQYKLFSQKIDLNDVDMLDKIIDNLPNLDFTITQSEVDDNSDLFAEQTLDKPFNFLENKEGFDLLKDRFSTGRNLYFYLNTIKNSDFKDKILKNEDILDLLATEDTYPIVIKDSIKHNSFSHISKIISREGFSGFNDFHSKRMTFNNKESVSALKETDTFDLALNRLRESNIDVFLQEMLVSSQKEEEIRVIEDNIPESKDLKRNTRTFFHSPTNEITKFFMKDDFFNKYYDEHSYNDLSSRNINTLTVGLFDEILDVTTQHSKGVSHPNFKDKSTLFFKWVENSDCDFNYKYDFDYEDLEEKITDYDILRFKNSDLVIDCMNILSDVYGKGNKELDLSLFLNHALVYYENHYSDDEEGYPELGEDLENKIELLHNIASKKDNLFVDSEQLSNEFGEDNPIVEKLLRIEREKNKNKLSI